MTFEMYATWPVYNWETAVHRAMRHVIRHYQTQSADATPSTRPFCLNKVFSFLLFCKYKIVERAKKNLDLHHFIQAFLHPLDLSASRKLNSQANLIARFNLDSYVLFKSVIAIFRAKNYGNLIFIYVFL